MTTINLFQKHNYINLTTFRKSGASVPTPVWFVTLNDKIFSFTGSMTGKAKRIRANGQAQIAPSDPRGKPLEGFIPARAQIMQDETIGKQLNALYLKKYGVLYRMLKWTTPFRGKSFGQPVFIEFTFEAQSVNG